MPKNRLTSSGLESYAEKSISSSGLESYAETSINLQWSGKVRRIIDYLPVVWKVMPKNRLTSSGLDSYAETSISVQWPGK